MPYNSTIVRYGGGGRNLSQLIATVRDNMNAGGGANTSLSSDPFWDSAELQVNLNNAQMELWKVAKNLRQDHFMEVMGSIDPAVIINGVNYSPADIRLVADVQYYTLPPDFGELKHIRVTTADRESTRFTPMDRTDEQFQTSFFRDAATGATEYFFDIVGRRTLVIAPIPPETLDIELSYIRRPKYMRLYAVGTVSITNGATALVGVGTTWTGNVVAGAQLVSGTINVNNEYGIVQTVTDNTNIVMAANYAGATLSGAAYTLADTPQLELESDEILVAYATQLGFRKGSAPNLKRANSWRDEYFRLLPGFKTGFAKRQIGGPVFIEAYLEDVEGAY